MLLGLWANYNALFVEWLQVRAQPCRDKVAASRGARNAPLAFRPRNALGEPL